jgi:hypothetical protein
MSLSGTHYSGDPRYSHHSVESTRRFAPSNPAKWIFWLAGILALSAPAAAELPPIHAGLAVRETYDNNVFLQDEGDLRRRDSFVTTITPSIATTLGGTSGDKTGPASLALRYSPEIAFFHSEHSEDYVAHAGSAALSARQGPWSFLWTNAATQIEGEDRSPLFLAPGGAPATGGPAIRDRRDQFAYRTSASIVYDTPDYFLRPAATGYVHDFQTEHSADVGYLNYVDRSEYTVGLDVGWKFMPDTALTLGYRFGSQRQADLLDVDLNYSNDFHRILVGVEGRPVKWLKVNASAGPDFRHFDGDPADGFDDRQTEFFADATLTLLPTVNDEISFTAKRFMQPGFGGRSVYNDSNYTLNWLHRFGKKLSTRVNFRAYNTDFEKPALREDWVYYLTFSAGLELHKNVTLDLGFTREVGDSELPDTEGREYHRTLAFVGITCNF